MASAQRQLQNIARPLNPILKVYGAQSEEIYSKQYLSLPLQDGIDSLQ